MPLPLPNLDDRSYQDLRDEAMALIPSLAPGWTHHNASDPGITLIELFAYLAELLLYRLNRVTDDSLRSFLKLLNGPEWVPGADLQADVRRAVLSLRENYRAVTAIDFERLALVGFNNWLDEQLQRQADGLELSDWWALTGFDHDSANLPSTLPRPARSLCVADRNLDGNNPISRQLDRPGQVSVVIVAAASVDTAGQRRLNTAIWGFLDPRRILTTRHQVVAPIYSPIQIDILIARRDDVLDSDVQLQVRQCLGRFLDPLLGGDDGQGWPFGRPVYVSELYRLIQGLSGIDHVVDILLGSICPDGELRCQEAIPDWNPDGSLIGLSLAGYCLPQLSPDALRIVVAPASRFITLNLGIAVTAPAAVQVDGLTLAIRQAMVEQFHPLRAGPALDSPGADIKIASLQQTISQIPGVGALASITFQSLPDRLTWHDGQVDGIHTAQGELIALRPLIAVTPV